MDRKSETAALPWSLIDQLLRARGALASGRKYGVYVVATEGAIEAIRHSGHPDAEFIANNLWTVAGHVWEERPGHPTRCAVCKMARAIGDGRNLKCEPWPPVRSKAHD